MMLPYSAEHKLLGRELRKNMTEAEQALWKWLRRKQILGVPFYRQKPLAHYIVDFYCAAAMLVIELDGSQHYTPGAQQYDAVRTQTLEKMGLRVLRFDNRQVLQELESVLEVIHAEVEKRLPPLAKGGTPENPDPAEIERQGSLHQRLKSGGGVFGIAYQPHRPTSRSRLLGAPIPGSPGHGLMDSRGRARRIRGRGGSGIAGSLGKAKTKVVVAVCRRVPVTVGGTHPRGVVVPRAAAVNHPGAYGPCPESIIA